MRWIVIGLCALGLSGCAGVPVAVSVASMAADGVSWVATGKTVTDHAVSEIAGADCRLIGILEDGKLCQDKPEYARTTVATLQPLPENGRAVASAAPAGGDPMRVPGDLSYLAAALETEGLAVAAPMPASGGTVAAFGPHAPVQGFTGRRERVLDFAGYLGDGLAGATSPQRR